MARGGIVVLSNCTKRSKEYYDSPLRVRAARLRVDKRFPRSVASIDFAWNLSSGYPACIYPPDSGINFDVAFYSIHRIGVFFSLKILREFNCVCKLSVRYDRIRYIYI